MDRVRVSMGADDKEGVGQLLSLDLVRVAIELVEGGEIGGFESCTLGIGAANLGTLGTDEAC